MRRIIILAALTAVLLNVPLAGRAQTTEVAGVKFPNTVQVANSRLQLNGAGIRYKVVFKVYAAALYLGQRAGSPDQVVALDGPKRLQMRMLLDVPVPELA